MSSRTIPPRRPTYRSPVARSIPTRRPTHPGGNLWKWFFIGGMLLAVLLLIAGVAILVWALAHGGGLG